MDSIVLAAGVYAAVALAFMFGLLMRPKSRLQQRSVRSTEPGVPALVGGAPRTESQEFNRHVVREYNRRQFRS